MEWNGMHWNGIIGTQRQTDRQTGKDGEQPAGIIESISTALMIIKVIRYLQYRFITQQYICSFPIPTPD